MLPGIQKNVFLNNSAQYFNSYRRCNVGGGMAGPKVQVHIDTFQIRQCFD